MLCYVMLCHEKKKKKKKSINTSEIYKASYIRISQNMKGRHGFIRG